MKICMISRSYVTNSSGGMEEYTEELCKNLAKENVNVVLITSAHPKGIEYEERDNVQIYYISDTQPASYRKGFFKKAFLLYKKLDKVYNFDLVHSQSSAALGLFYSRLDKPMVVTMHGGIRTETKLAPHFMKGKSLLGRIISYLSTSKRIVLHLLTMHMINNVNKIIVPSEFTKKNFMTNKNKNKISVVNHGIDGDKLLKIDKQIAKNKLNLNDKIVILCLSRLVKEKGIHLMIEALGQINNRYKNVLLIIGGKGEEEQNLRRLAADIGIENVQFAGFISEDEKSLYYSAADIFVYPELTNPAFGLVAAEAMACGTPVIASNHGAIREVINDEEYLFNPGDTKGLVDKLSIYLGKSPEFLELKNEEVKQRQSEYFEMSRMIKKTISIYKEVLTKGK